MIFNLAGHNPNGLKPDPGAIGNGYHEADLTVEFRNLVTAMLRAKGLEVVTDKDDERLDECLKRIKTGNGSVVLEFHFDAAGTSTATGSTVLIGNDSDRLDKAFAKELVEACATTLSINNRGVRTEAESHRGSLGLMREQGTVALLEICFITNKEDLRQYQNNKMSLAYKIAEIIERYEKLI